MAPFSKQEFKDAIAKCSSLSTPGPDHISWRHLKSLITNKRCLQKIVQIANACIKLEFWPSHFKLSISQKVTYLFCDELNIDSRAYKQS